MRSKHHSAAETLQRAFEFYQKNDLLKARLLCKKVLSTQKNCHEAHHLLGIVELGNHKYKQAIRSLSTATKLCPQSPFYYNNLALALQKDHQLSPAEQAFVRATELDKTYYDALYNLALLRKVLGKNEEAMHSFEQYLAHNPRDAKAWQHLAILCVYSGQQERALEGFTKAHELCPDDEEIHLNLAHSYFLANSYDQAIQTLQELLQKHPHNTEACFRLSQAYIKNNETERAFHLLRAFLSQYEACHSICDALGSIYCFLQDFPQAYHFYERSLQISPEESRSQHNLLFLSLHDKDLLPLDVAEKHKHWGNSVEKETPPFVHKKRSLTTPLRIAYLSPDFRNHPVGKFILPLLQHHDKEAFHIHCYHTEESFDSITGEIQKLVHTWSSVSHLSKKNLAEKIYQDEIDILVDLTGHAGHSSLHALAYKPAPIQISYLGYPGTTGLSRVDYRLSDAYSDPVGSEALYSETLLRMKHSFLCFSPPREGEIDPICAFEKNRYITFGSFNHIRKLNPSTLALWAEILRQLPSSHLLIKDRHLADPFIAKSLKSLLTQYKAPLSRVHFIARTDPQKEHLETYNTVDIALDPFPYNGTTTTCETLWMGTPLLTLQGESHISRVSAHLLKLIGAEELIATSSQEYIQKCLALAQDEKRLKNYRKELRTRLEQSPLCDALAFTQELETIYQKLWSQWSP